MPVDSNAIVFTPHFFNHTAIFLAIRRCCCRTAGLDWRVAVSGDADAYGMSE